MKFIIALISLFLSESPVPLEFTPVLGIFIGVFATLFLVAFVTIMILRMKYRTGKDIFRAK